MRKLKQIRWISFTQSDSAKLSRFTHLVEFATKLYPTSPHCLSPCLTYWSTDSRSREANSSTLIFWNKHKYQTVSQAKSALPSTFINANSILPHKGLNTLEPSLTLSSHTWAFTTKSLCFFLNSSSYICCFLSLSTVNILGHYLFLRPFENLTNSISVPSLFFNKSYIPLSIWLQRWPGVVIESLSSVAKMPEFRTSIYSLTLYELFSISVLHFPHF